MSSNIPINSPFLRVQRKFPLEPQMLSVELERAYIEIAGSVNSRAISLFSDGQTVPNGQVVFIGGQKYQGLQRIYYITATGNTPHLLNTQNIFAFTSISGTFNSGTNFFPLPLVDVVNADNQISLSLTNTDIVITPGAGSPPAFDFGIVTLSWIVPV